MPNNSPKQQQHYEHEGGCKKEKLGGSELNWSPSFFCVFSLSLQFAPPSLKMSDFISALIKEAGLMEGAHPDHLASRPARCWLRRSHSQTRTGSSTPLRRRFQTSRSFTCLDKLRTNIDLLHVFRAKLQIKKAQIIRNLEVMASGYGEMWESRQLFDRLNNQISFRTPPRLGQTVRTVCKNIFALAVVLEVNKSPDKHRDLSLKQI